MISEEFFGELKEKIMPYFEDGGSHEFSHTQRVYNMSLILSKGESVDIDIVRAAAMLHDIARGKEDEGLVDCHAEEGAIMARKILEDFDFPEDKIDDVCYAIEVHRHSKGVLPKTKEAAILQDADRLDALGAITIARMFATGGKIGIPLYDSSIPLGTFTEEGYSACVYNGFYDKIVKIKPETFKTQKAKELARERYDYVLGFLDQFKKEWEGEL